MSHATAHHLGELTLRRLRAGELSGEAASSMRAHLESCPPCAAKLERLSDEQQRFESELSFDRFAAGVERAAREQTARQVSSRWHVRLYPVLGMAAAAILTVSLGGGSGIVAQHATNRTKGAGGSVEIVVAPATGPQRTASPNPAAPEGLTAGDRLRLGFAPGQHRYLTSISIDEEGQITPLYPEVGSSLAVSSGNTIQYLPESLELTGSGLERVIVLLSDRPLELEAVRRAADEAFHQAGGNLTDLGPLKIEGEQFHRTFLKP